jgi:hypothetical protein
MFKNALKMKIKHNMALGGLIFLFAVMAPAWAGPGHDHDHDEHSHDNISSEQAKSKAISKIKHLAESGKIDASWASVSPSQVEQKSFSKGSEWVVSFKNNKVADKEKQTLYVFYTLDGHYLATNYSGQ